jgi:hypothetical protein
MTRFRIVRSSQSSARSAFVAATLFTSAAVAQELDAGDTAVMTPEMGVEQRLDGVEAWREQTTLQVMSSGFYLFNSHTEPGPLNTIGYPYETGQGFNFTFAGLDLAYDGKSFGGRIDLRFGPGAPLLTGIAPVKQALAWWSPSDSLSFSLGFFDTIYGVEVADEWQNANFTRGALYFLRQPFNHMGLLTTVQLTDDAWLKVMVANGNVGLTGVSVNGSGSLGGQSTEFNSAPSVGAQAGYTVGNSQFILGYLAGTNGLGDNTRWAHFFDFIYSLEVGGFQLKFNADATIDAEPEPGVKNALVWGGSLAMQYRFADRWRVGVRGEYLSGNPQSGEVDYLTTVTGTLRYSPVDALVFSLEPRAEFSDAALYNAEGGTKNWYFGFLTGATIYHDFL